MNMSFENLSKFRDKLYNSEEEFLLFGIRSLVHYDLRISYGHLNIFILFTTILHFNISMAALFSSQNSWSHWLFLCLPVLISFILWEMTRLAIEWRHVHVFPGLIFSLPAIFDSTCSSGWNLSRILSSRLRWLEVLKLVSIEERSELYSSRNHLRLRLHWSITSKAKQILLVQHISYICELVSLDLREFLELVTPHRLYS